MVVIKIYYKKITKKLRRPFVTLHELRILGGNLAGCDGNKLLYSYVDPENDEIDLMEEEDVETMLSDIGEMAVSNPTACVRVYIRQPGEAKRWKDRNLRTAWVTGTNGERKPYSSKSPLHPAPAHADSATPSQSEPGTHLAAPTRDPTTIEEKVMRIVTQDRRKQRIDQTYQKRIRLAEEEHRRATEMLEIEYRKKIEEIERKIEEEIRREERRKDVTQGGEFEVKENGRKIQVQGVILDEDEYFVKFKWLKERVPRASKDRLDKIIARNSQASLEGLLKEVTLYYSKKHSSAQQIFITNPPPKQTLRRLPNPTPN